MFLTLIVVRKVENILTPLPGQFPYSQALIPGAIGEQWSLDVQNIPDQSFGTDTAFPLPSYMNDDVHCDKIAFMTPTYDVRRSLEPLVPQRQYANSRRNRGVRNFKPEPSIYFDTYSGQGFPMKDALEKNFRTLVGREDPMPYGTAISLRFEFEGYESWTRQVKTRDSRRIPHPIPREKLAHEVAKRLVTFLNKKRATIGSPSEEAAHLNSVGVKDLVLVRLDHVSKASWQPQFKIVRGA